jgi:hypothetical protein
MTDQASNAKPPDPIAVSPGAGPIPPISVGQPNVVSSLLWPTVRWALYRTGILQADRTENG